MGIYAPPGTLQWSQTFQYLPKFDHFREKLQRSDPNRDVLFHWVAELCGLEWYFLEIELIYGSSVKNSCMESLKSSNLFHYFSELKEKIQFFRKTLDFYPSKKCKSEIVSKPPKLTVQFSDFQSAQNLSSNIRIFVPTIINSINVCGNDKSK